MPDSKNLWPEFEAKKIRNPKSILQEQALFLGERTGNVLKAEVRTDTAAQNTIRHTFEIIAPSLKFRYNLFAVTHQLFYYPLKIIWTSIILANDENEFLRILEKILKSEDTVKVINNLLSQSIE